MLIFGTGVITGALVIRESERIRAPRPPKQATIRPPGNAGLMRVELLRRMERELELSSEQRELVDKIIKESQERTRKIMEPVMPQMREELQVTKERFRAVLTPEQRERFDELSKQPQRPRDRGERDPRREKMRPPTGPSTVPSPSGNPGSNQ